MPGLLDPGTPPPLPQAPPQAGPPQPQGMMPNGLLGGPIADPTVASYYAPPQDPRVAEMLHGRQMAAMAGAFGQAAQPTPYRTGLLNFIGSIGPAANAYAQGGDPLIQARTQAMQGELYGAQAQTQLATIAAHQQMAALGAQLMGPDGAGTAAGGGAGAGAGAGGGPGTAKAPKLLPGGSAGGVGAGNVYQYALSIGASPNQATMITSAAGAESGYHPDAIHDGGIGYGLFGHNTNRLAAMYDFAKVQPGQPVPWQQQVQFALNELKGSEAKAGALVDAATTPEQLARAQLAFERPKGWNTASGGPSYGTRLSSTTELMTNPPPAPTINQAGTAAGAIGRPRIAGNVGTPQGLITGGPTVPEAAPAVAGGAPGGLPQVPNFAAQFGGAPPPQQPPIALAGTAAGALGRPRMGGTVPAPAVGAGSGGGAPPPPPLGAGGDTAAPPAAPPGLLAGGAVPAAVAGQRPAMPPQAPPQQLPTPNIAPVPQGAPAGPQTAQAAPAPAPAPSGPPGATGGLPGAMPAQSQIAGAPSPEKIRIAQQMVAIGSAWGIPVSPIIQEIAKFPLIGPEAEAQSAGTARGSFPYTVMQKQLEPQNIRGGGGQLYNPLDQTFTGTRQRIVNGEMHSFAGQWKLDGTPIHETDMGQTALSPFQTKQQEATAGATPIPQQQPPPQPSAPPRPGFQGTPVAPGMTTKQPDYPEPAYTPEQLSKNTERWGNTNKEIAASVAPAQAAEQRLTTMAHAFQMIDTGRFTTDKAEWNMILDGIFGANGGPQWMRTATDSGAVMTALHETMRATLSNLKATNPRFANAEFQSLSKLSENPDLPASANLNMLAEDIGTLRQQQALANDWTEARIGDPRAGVAGKQDPEIYENKWLRENPLQPIVEGVRKEIGIDKLAPPGPPGERQHPPAGYDFNPRTGKLTPRTQ